MKRVILFLSLITSAHVFSQMTIQYGGSFGLHMQYRALTNHTDPWMVNDGIISGRNDYEKIDLRPSLGADFKFNFNEKMGLRTGVAYDVKGYRWKLNVDFGGGVTGVAKAKEFNHNITIPIYFSYLLGSIELFGGAANNFYLKTNGRTVIKYNDGSSSISKSDHSNYSRYLGQAVLGANYFITSQIYTGLDFKFGFNSLTGSTNIREYPWSVGLNAGILFGGS